MNWLWLLTAASLIGTILNIKKHPACFAIWLTTNSGWVIVNYRAGIYPAAALFAVYTGLAVWGLIEWRTTSKKESDI